MGTDEQIIQAIDAAFGSVERPRRFHPDDGDPESENHDALLQSRNRETLLLSDVDNPGWDPLCSCSGHGIAYFFPALARFALPKECDPLDWYADQLLFHLTYDDHNNVFLRFCTKPQRLAVAELIDHIIHSRAAWVAESYRPEQFGECLSLWRSECE
jgi:hypothetical protein